MTDDTKLDMSAGLFMDGTYAIFRVQSYEDVLKAIEALNKLATDMHADKDWHKT